MKTVIIHGQNHKGSTYHAGRIFVEKVATESEITEFFLPRDLNHFCLGCYQCMQAEEKCPFYEEKKVIMDAMEQAELLVFTTPTYCMRASGAMKSFIDLTFINWMPHRPRKSMFHKKAVVISTAAGAGTRSAMKDIKTCLGYWGVPYIKTLGFTVQAAGWKDVSDKCRQKIERKTQKLAKKVRKAKVRVGLKTRFVFLLMKMSGNNPEKLNTPMETDYLYWKNHGWFDGKKPWK